LQVSQMVIQEVMGFSNYLSALVGLLRRVQEKLKGPIAALWLVNIFECQ